MWHYHIFYLPWRLCSSFLLSSVYTQLRGRLLCDQQGPCWSLCGCTTREHELSVRASGTLHSALDLGVGCAVYPATCRETQRLRDIPKEESLWHSGYLSHIPVLLPAYHFLNGCFVLVSSKPETSFPPQWIGIIVVTTSVWLEEIHVKRLGWGLVHSKCSVKGRFYYKHRRMSQPRLNPNSAGPQFHVPPPPYSCSLSTLRCLACSFSRIGLPR